MHGTEDGRVAVGLWAGALDGRTGARAKEQFPKGKRRSVAALHAIPKPHFETSGKMATVARKIASFNTAAHAFTSAMNEQIEELKQQWISAQPLKSEDEERLWQKYRLEWN